MKYRHLILRNLFRKKIRTTLTLGSFAVALFLFGLLAVVRGAFNQGVDVAAADRLTVINKTSIIQPLPISYEDRIRQIKGVALVTHQNWFGGVYQDPKNFFAQMAVEDETFFQVFPEFVVPPEQLAAYMADQQGVVVGKKIADRFGWKIGDRVPIKGTIFPGEWDFNVRAIYTGKRRQDDQTQFWFHFKNIDQWVQTHGTGYYRGMVGWYTVKIENPDDAPRIAKDIDNAFANSPWETKTEAEKAFANNFAKQAGNISFLVTVIGTVVFFTLLLVTGNTMATAVRERTRELAVLKAVGFSDRFVLMLVFAESLVLAIFGGGAGLLVIKAATLYGADPTGGMLGAFYLPTASVVLGIGLALLVGVASGFFPALSAMRLRVVDALRRV